MTNQDTTSIDEQLDRILWYPGLGQEEQYKAMREAITKLISDQVAKAYRRGWRDHQRLAAERDVKDRLSQLRSKE